MHWPVIVSSYTCSQMHVQIQHSLPHLQDVIPTLAGVIASMLLYQPKHRLNLVDVLGITDKAAYLSKASK